MAQGQDEGGEGREPGEPAVHTQRKPWGATAAEKKLGPLGN